MSTPMTPATNDGGPADDRTPSKSASPSSDRTGDAAGPGGTVNQPGGYVDGPTSYADQPGGYVDRPTSYADQPGEYADRSTGSVASDHADVVARQRERFGGIKVGSAFFGWLTATGMAVLLIAVLAAAGVVFGVATDTTVDQAMQESQAGTGTAQTVGLVGAIALLVVLLLAYYCGGYVAGRMARFNGLRQGFAVWLWGVVLALVTATVAAIAGAQYDIFAQLNLPRLPVNEGQVTAVGAIAIGAAILAALVGALLGGLAGMRFHRKVDRAALEPIERASS